MPRPYSGDLRERAIEEVRSGASRREVAERFDVSPSSVINWCGAGARLVCLVLVELLGDFILGELVARGYEDKNIGEGLHQCIFNSGVI